MRLPLQGPAMRLVFEDLAHNLRTPSPFLYRPPRQSRGFRTRSDDFVQARSHTRGRSCDHPESSFQMARAQGARSRCVRSVSASQHSVNEHSYPRLLPGYRHRLFVGRVLDGLPPTKTGDLCVSRRTESLWRIAHVPWGRVSPNPRPSFDRTSDVPVAILFDTGARLFAVRAVPIR
jgi:hypothetical protein